MFSLQKITNLRNQHFLITYIIMSQNVWGSITWLLFHSFAEKIKEEQFINIKDRFIIFIKDDVPLYDFACYTLFS